MKIQTLCLKLSQSFHAKNAQTRCLNVRLINKCSNRIYCYDLLNRSLFYSFVPLCLKGKKKVGAVRSTKNSKTTRASSRRAQGKEMLNSFQVASEEMEAVCKDSFLGGSQSKLYIPYDTWACIKNGCVCCAYKLLVTRPNLSISGRVF